MPRSFGAKGHLCDDLLYEGTSLVSHTCKAKQIAGTRLRSKSIFAAAFFALMIALGLFLSERRTLTSSTDKPKDARARKNGVESLIRRRSFDAVDGWMDLSLLLLLHR